MRFVRTHNVALTGAQIVYPGVSFGTSLRYVRGSVGMAAGNPGLTVDELLTAAGELAGQGQSELDLDLGVMIGTRAVRVGLVARNLLPPSFDTPEGGRVRLDRQVRAGLGIRTVGDLLVSVDVDITRSRSEAVGGVRRNLAVGVEHWFGEWLGLRGGARVNLEDDDRQAVGAFGLSLALTSGVYLDGQLTRARDSIDRGWGIAARVGF